MGRYARQDEKLGQMLGAQEAWFHFRDMDLYSAMEGFEEFKGRSDKVGAARTYIEFMDLFSSLDEFSLELELQFLAALGDGATLEQKLRKAFILLRKKDVSGARAEFKTAEGASPFLLALGEAWASAIEGTPPTAFPLPGNPKPADENERLVGRIVCFLAKIPYSAPSGDTPYDQAIKGLSEGLFKGSLLALQMVDFASDNGGVHSRLFIYPLLNRSIAEILLSALGTPDSAGTAFLAAAAHEALGDFLGAATLYRRAAEGGGRDGDELWVFSPYHGAEEASEMANIYRGATLMRGGMQEEGLEVWRRMESVGIKSPLAAASLARLKGALSAGRQAEEGEYALSCLKSMRQAVSLLPSGEEGEVLYLLYSTRLAAASRLAANFFTEKGEFGQALDIMSKAHHKTEGYRPNFGNTPGFMTDLAKSYAYSGDFAVAGAIVFELENSFPSVRAAQDSLKRLYGQRAGGEAPPR